MTLVVEPPTLSAGSHATVTVVTNLQQPDQLQRSILFTIEATNGTLLFYVLDAAPDSSEWFSAQDPPDTPSVGISATVPASVVIPDPLQPGSYLLCTKVVITGAAVPTNVQACGSFTVTQ